MECGRMWGAVEWAGAGQTRVVGSLGRAHAPLQGVIGNLEGCTMVPESLGVQHI